MEEFTIRTNNKYCTKRVEGMGFGEGREEALCIHPGNSHKPNYGVPFCMANGCPFTVVKE